MYSQAGGPSWPEPAQPRTVTGRTPNESQLPRQVGAIVGCPAQIRSANVSASDSSGKLRSLEPHREMVAIKRWDHRVVPDSDSEFDRWFELNTRDRDRRSPKDEAGLRAWFRELFDRRGSIGHADFEAAFQIRQAEIVQRAITDVIEDVFQTTGRCPMATVGTGPELLVAYWGVNGTLKKSCGLSRPATDELDLFVVAAGDLRDNIRDDMNEVWPRCHVHQFGMHPGICDDVPIWWCHSVTAIRWRISDR